MPPLSFPPFKFCSSGVSKRFSHNQIPRAPPPRGCPPPAVPPASRHTPYLSWAPSNLQLVRGTFPMKSRQIASTLERSLLWSFSLFFFWGGASFFNGLPVGDICGPGGFVFVLRGCNRRDPPCPRVPGTRPRAFFWGPFPLCFHVKPWSQKGVLTGLNPPPVNPPSCPPQSRNTPTPSIKTVNWVLAVMKPIWR